MTFQPYCELAKKHVQELDEESKKHPPAAQPSYPAVPHEISLTNWWQKTRDALPAMPWKDKQANAGTSPTPALPTPADGSSGPRSLPQGSTP